MKIGDLVCHMFQGRETEHGMIVEIKEGCNKLYCKIQWLGDVSARHSQWFPERELQVISRAHIDV